MTSQLLPATRRSTGAHWFKGCLRGVSLCAAFGVGLTAGLTTMATPAQAWWRGGGGVVVGIAPPFFGPPIIYPPVVYPPPVVYAPPPVVYSPPPPVVYAPPGPSGPQVAAGYGRSCYAGPYVCPSQSAAGPGAPCACLGNDGQQIFGQTR